MELYVVLLVFIHGNMSPPIQFTKQPDCEAAARAIVSTAPNVSAMCVARGKVV